MQPAMGSSLRSRRVEAGFSSYAAGWAIASRDPAVPPLDASGVVALAAGLGYRRVQLADNVPLHALAPPAREALHNQARAANIALEVGTRGLTTANLVTYTEIAASFGSPFLRIVIDAAGYEPDPDAVIAFLREHVPLLERRGVVLAIENHDRFTSAELACIIAAVDSPWVAICLDTANSLGAAEDIYTVVGTLGPYTVNVHLKDIRIRRVPHLQGFTVEGTALGDGQIPLDWVVAQLTRYGRCRTATLEHWVSPEAHPADTVRKERAWCTRSTTTMRRLFPNSFATGPESRHVPGPENAPARLP
jgi:3-oxoisoapionate decarboxylase